MYLITHAIPVIQTAVTEPRQPCTAGSRLGFLIKFLRDQGSRSLHRP